MPKGYWIVRIDVTDQAQFAKYAQARGQVLHRRMIMQDLIYTLM